MKTRLVVLSLALILVCFSALAENSTSERNYLTEQYYFLREGTSPTIKSAEVNEGLILNYKITKNRNSSYSIEMEIGSTAISIREETIPIIITKDRFDEIKEKMTSAQKKRVSISYTTLKASPQDYYVDVAQIEGLIPKDKEILMLKQGISGNALDQLKSAYIEIGYTEQDKINDLKAVDYEQFAHIQCSPVYSFYAPYIDRSFTREEFIAVCTFLDSIREDCIAYQAQKPNNFFESGTKKAIVLNGQNWNMEYFELRGNSIYFILIPEEIDPNADVWYCQKCGKWNENGNYCVSCGTPRDISQIVCRNCGYKIKENADAKYCPECGAKIE